MATDLRSEGVATCLLAPLFSCIPANFPEQVSWLTGGERLFIKDRLEAEQGDSVIGKPIWPWDVLTAMNLSKVSLAGVIHL